MSDHAEAHRTIAPICARYLTVPKRSLIITTNIEFSKRDVVFGDDKLASAAIGRLIHHERLVEFNGMGKRMDHALMLVRGTKGRGKSQQLLAESVEIKMKKASTKT